VFQSVRVVDSFSAAPAQARRLAIERGRWLPRKGLYSVETSNSFYTDSLVELLEKQVQKKIEFDPKTMGFGVFAYYPGGAPVQLTTHFDDTEWSAVVYLAPDDMCEGGTGIYRHIPMGVMGPLDSQIKCNT
jgi:hypothetical protein